MSKAKGLEFSSSEPAFLRRMRGEISGRTDDPDRQVGQVGRSKAPKRLANDDEDDGPTYVLEESNDTLSKEEYEAMVKKQSNDNEDAAKPTDSKEDAEPAKAKQKVAAIGGTKKRKAAKVIGADDEDEKDGKDTPLGKAIEKASGKGKSEEKKPPKKKKAKVNLTFGDDEEP